MDDARAPALAAAQPGPARPRVRARRRGRRGRSSAAAVPSSRRTTSPPCGRWRAGAAARPAAARRPRPRSAPPSTPGRSCGCTCSGRPGTSCRRTGCAALIALTGPRLATSLAGAVARPGLPAELPRAGDRRARGGDRRAGAADPGRRAAACSSAPGSASTVSGCRTCSCTRELAGVLTSGPTRGREHTWAPGRRPDAAGAVALDRGGGAARARADLRAQPRAGDGAGPGLVGGPAADRRPRRRWRPPGPSWTLARGDRAPVLACGAAPAGTGAPAGRPCTCVQSYDEYLVAHTESRGLADPHGFARHMPRGRAARPPPSWSTGVLVGRWRRGCSEPAGRRRGDAVTCAVPRAACARRARRGGRALRRVRRAAAAARRQEEVTAHDPSDPVRSRRAATSGRPTTAAG